MTQYTQRVKITVTRHVEVTRAVALGLGWITVFAIHPLIKSLPLMLQISVALFAYFFVAIAYIAIRAYIVGFIEGFTKSRKGQR
jgi:hypothetical protein